MFRLSRRDTTLHSATFLAHLSPLSPSGAVVAGQFLVGWEAPPQSAFSGLLTQADISGLPNNKMANPHYHIISKIEKESLQGTVK